MHNEYLRSLGFIDSSSKLNSSVGERGLDILKERILGSLEEMKYSSSLCGYLDGNEDTLEA